MIYVYKYVNCSAYNTDPIFIKCSIYYYSYCVWCLYVDILDGVAVLWCDLMIRHKLRKLMCNVRQDCVL